MPLATATGPITATAVCEIGQHHRCRGTVRSIVHDDHPCTCDCHGGDDLAVEAILEAQHYSEV